MSPYLFREEEKPRFNLRVSTLLALLLLALFLLLTAKTSVFRLSAEELRVMEEQKARLEREMVFRFMDAPEDPVENKDARFLSDADHLTKSQSSEKTPDRNSDPFSRGNSLELEQSITPPTEYQARQKPPAPAPRPPRESPRETPAEPVEEIAETQKERESELDPVGNQPLFEGGPKPYRKLTEAERLTVKEKAVREMNALQFSPNVPRSSSTRQYKNPEGSNAPLTGLSVETSRDDLGAYLRILRQLIKGNWRIPNIARYEARGVAVIYFKLRKDGMITDAYIVTSSSYEPLDTAALNAINNTHKAPPLPEHIEEEWLPMKFGFYYNVRPRY